VRNSPHSIPVNCVANIDVRQTNAFLRAYKKLHANQKDAVDQAVADIVLAPLIGESKKGDLAGVYVYKFKCVQQLFLLAYPIFVIPSQKTARITADNIVTY